MCSLVCFAAGCGRNLRISSPQPLKYIEIIESFQKIFFETLTNHVNASWVAAGMVKSLEISKRLGFCCFELCFARSMVIYSWTMELQESGTLLEVEMSLILIIVVAAAAAAVVVVVVVVVIVVIVVIIIISIMIKYVALVQLS